MSLALADGSVGSTNAGMASQVLIDLQKLYCCLEMYRLETINMEPSNQMRVTFKDAVSSAEFSSRVTLALRSHAGLKLLDLSWC